jgi:hypothetical protein
VSIQPPPAPPSHVHPSQVAAAKGHMGIIFLLLTEFMEELSLECGSVRTGQQSQQQQQQQGGSGTPASRGTQAAPSGNEGSAALDVARWVGGLKVDRRQPGNQLCSAMHTVPCPPASLARRLVEARNWHGFTPLHMACWGRQAAAVQILLQHGADLLAK